MPFKSSESTESNMFTFEKVEQMSIGLGQDAHDSDFQHFTCIALSIFGIALAPSCNQSLCCGWWRVVLKAKTKAKHAPTWEYFMTQEEGDRCGQHHAGDSHTPPDLAFWFPKVKQPPPPASQCPVSQGVYDFSPSRKPTMQWAIHSCPLTCGFGGQATLRSLCLSAPPHR